MKKQISLLILLVTMLGVAHAQDFVWLESQDTASISVKNDKIKTETSGWGHKEFLSGDSWFAVKVENGGDVEKVVPDEGIVLSYKVNIAKEAKYEIWNRIGFEFVRSPFDWRVDNGEWARVEPTQLTTDLMALAVWTEVGVAQIRRARLESGRAHFGNSFAENQKREKRNSAYSLCQ